MDGLGELVSNYRAVCGLNCGEVRTELRSGSCGPVRDGSLEEALAWEKMSLV